MLDRAAEEEHLRLAEEHIRHAEELMTWLQQLIDHARSRGGDVKQAMRSLDALGDVLATFVAHRDAILETIASIESKKL